MSSYAQNELDPSSAYDCTAVELDAVDASKLTKEEQIALLEESLFNSVDKYSTCMEKVQKKMSASTAKGSGANGGGAGANGASGSNGGSGASAGTGASESAATSSGSSANSENTNTSNSETNSNRSGSSGAENKIVAPKDNDSVVCGMIYEEIGKESDPVAKEKLKEQYKQYNCGRSK
ncbi:hypothetical protein ACSLBF_17735 (plasmid) [Pseudoalteromonas sp. T1lg65]|uniref:hypothetical protein n=1 Tax=Pseudoalteromonas sp. T1lg65 TaxID=2077101 RepID=UPI003F794FB8